MGHTLQLSISHSSANILCFPRRTWRSEDSDAGSLLSDSEFDSESDETDVGELILYDDRDMDGSQLGSENPTFRFKATEPAFGNRAWDTFLYKGELEIVGSSQKCEVVCKMTNDPHRIIRMRTEAGFYEKQLSSLQGEIIPRYYGFFVSPVPGFPPDFSCLVLEYCGECIGEHIRTIDDVVKLKIAEAFQAIHRAGVRHNDVDYPPDLKQHILLDPLSRRITVVDFDCAEPHPKCPSADIPIVLNDFEKLPKEFQCIELFEICTSRELTIWIPRGLPFKRAMIPLTSARKMDKLRDYLQQYHPALFDTVNGDRAKQTEAKEFVKLADSLWRKGMEVHKKLKLEGQVQCNETKDSGEVQRKQISESEEEDVLGQLKSLHLR